MQNQPSPNEPQQSKYNSAVAQLYRLDMLWREAHIACLAGDFNRYKFILDRLWIEFSADSIPQEFKDRDKDMKEINSAMTEKISSVDSSSQDSKKEINQKIRTKKSKVYNILMKYEIFLRKLQNRQGKGSAYQESDEEVY